MAGKAQQTQKLVIRVSEAIPEETWYWAAVASIGISAVLKLNQKDNWAIFVGQWPPTFLLFGLFNRLLQPAKK
jgi:hypothetical protein